MSDEKTTNIAPELPPFDAGYRIGRQDGALYGLSAGSDAPDMITRRGEYYRAQLAPPEPLPEDVEALAMKMAAMINTSIWPVEKWNSLARLVLADRQRAVKEAVAEIQRRITREMDHADLHGMEDAALVDNIHGAVWNYADEIRARGAA